MSLVFIQIKQWLVGQSFRTGMVVAALCVISYIVSFAQMLLPVSATTKGVLWAMFFGLAKTFQYVALLILGTAGLTRIKAMFKVVAGRDKKAVAPTKPHRRTNSAEIKDDEAEIS